MPSVSAPRDFKVTHAQNEHVLKHAILEAHVLKMDNVYAIEGLRERHVPRHREKHSSVRISAPTRVVVMLTLECVNVTWVSEILIAVRECVLSIL